uniref:POU domain protein n=1 Tax=Angiostrongylus cantonensis TaxID=6313 RepID=A0A0K0CV74_ANGCA
MGGKITARQRTALVAMQEPQRLYPSLSSLQGHLGGSIGQASSGRYSPSSAYRSRMQPQQFLASRHQRLSPNLFFDLQFNNSLFGSFDDPLFQARAAQVALADMDMKVNITNPLMRPHDMFRFVCQLDFMFNCNYLMTSTQDPTNIYHGLPAASEGFDASMLVPTSSDQEQMTPLQQVMAMQNYSASSHFHQYPMASSFPSAIPPQVARYPLAAPTTEIDTDPRELERFAEHFKQRRIKLGVTQADVGKALAHLKMPGVGSLSQSTICRFESLTLSHNNMVALKPILHSWLEKAEEAMKQKDGCGDISGILPNTDKKRKRTSIAAPEKRLLEDYFRQQPRPSGERIAAIADKLDLKKNVVRVWFCNQRQKQKR